MHRVVGTAGHIDHGKTALVRALTGIDTDRLKEEKERGISIDLGFAYLDLDSGERVAVVDVPGHERFIKNMLAGAHGIDLALLVVAADDGVMPQTEEHLDILHLLGVERGVVAITKIDRVDAAQLVAVRDEIEILVAGTMLEDAPVVPVSVVSGAGLAELRQCLERQLATITRPRLSSWFRLPIDRVFSLHGHGTVVTGTAVSGTVRPGDMLHLLPGGTRVRVRTVQTHDTEVGEAGAGQRIALNLVSSDRLEIERGHVICDPRLDLLTDRFDAWIEIRPSAGIVLKGARAVRLHHLTTEVLARVTPLAADQLAPRQSGFAQLVLRQPIAVMRGDRFVLRNETAQRTIGGGTVIHPFARRHRRRDPVLLEQLLPLQRAGDEREVLRALIALDGQVAVAIDWLAQATGWSVEQVVAVAGSEPSLRLLPSAAAPTACAEQSRWAEQAATTVAQLEAAHAAEPLASGVEMESLRSRLGGKFSANLFRTLIDAMAAAGTIVRDDSRLRLPSHQPQLASQDEDLARRIEKALEQGGFLPPDRSELEATLKIARAPLQALLQLLERQGRVVKIAEAIYFARAPLERARELVRQPLERGGTISAAQLRDLLGASRKFSIALLDYFDRTGFTLRVGDLRKLNPRVKP